MENLQLVNSYLGSGWNLLYQGVGYTTRTILNQFQKSYPTSCDDTKRIITVPSDIIPSKNTLNPTKFWHFAIWFGSGFVLCLLMPNIFVVLNKSRLTFNYICNSDTIVQVLHKIYKRTAELPQRIFAIFSDNRQTSNLYAISSQNGDLLRPFVSLDTDIRRADVPENAPDSCPGVYSEQAGVDEGCDGCPNQRLCATGEARKPDPVVSEGLQQLNMIRHKILILSGKGGVGKSTVASQLAWALQRRRFYVGLLDVDICGPSIPRMTGTMGSEVHLSAAGWEPIYVEDNFGVMSIGFLLPGEDDAVIWRGPKKNALIRQFLTDVTWGDLDFLIIDTPPGTSDEHLSIATFLKETQIDGAVIVTTPQEVALQDVRKEINFCKKVNIPVLGVIENMSGSVFESTTSGGAKAMAKYMGVKYSGSLPLDKPILEATERGVFVEDIDNSSIAGEKLQIILNDILASINEPEFNILGAVTDVDGLPTD